MYVIAKTFCSFPDAEESLEALVELTPELLASIAKRKKMFFSLQKKDRSLTEIYFWDGSCDWYEADAFDELGEKEILFRKRQPKAMSTSARSECEQMILSARGVSWVMIPKHSSVYVNTTIIEWEQLEKLS